MPQACEKHYTNGRPAVGSFDREPPENLNRPVRGRGQATANG